MSAGTSGWIGSHGFERALSEALVQAERDYQRYLQALQVLHRVSKWLDDQSRAVDQERIAAHGRREAIWRRRCLELLGDPLVNEACAGGLPK